MQKLIPVLSVSIFCLTAILAQPEARADEKTISGTVKIAPSLSAKTEKGTLFVFARAAGEQSGPPAAVARIPNPKFPQVFSLGAAQAMIPGTEFKGPFRLTARYSPSGDAMQKEGAFEGKTDGKKPLAPGAKGVEIIVDTPR